MAIMKTSASTTKNVARYQLLSRLLAGRTGEKLEQLLAETAGTFGVEQTGLRWPIQGSPQINCVAGWPAADESGKWDLDAIGRLADAPNSADAFLDPRDSKRLLIPLLVDGRRNGVFWVTRGEGFGEDDWHALVAVAQCFARHPAFLERIGFVSDPSRVAQRMQDAAAVAGRIAHDFDNIFTGVVGFAEMVQSLLTPGTLPHQYVGEVMSAGNRGIQFTQQLHNLSRSGIARSMPTGVSNVLAREEVRLKKLPNQNVRLQFASPSDLPAVAMDGGALQMLLGSILDNAVEASPANSAVRVSAALIELSDAEAHEFLGAASAGPYIEMRISDEGPGVTDENRKRLFVEPFFTTKVRHRGLGLPVAYRILHAHRGGARYEFIPGRGSVVHMVLPLASARSVDSGAAPIETKRFPGGNAS